MPTPHVNPYTLLNPELLAALMRQPLWFVRQHYPRGRAPFPPDTTLPLLLTFYLQDETGRERAQRHLRLLKKDPCRYLYDSTLPDHREKLGRAAAQPRGYRVYVNLLPGPWKPSETLKTHLNRYLQEYLPQWKPRGADHLKVILKERYGELYVVLHWKHHQTEVHLDLIENFSPCATT